MNLDQPGVAFVSFSHKDKILQTATFSNGKFTEVTGAFTPYGVPLGSSTGQSGILRYALNGLSQAQRLGMILTRVATLLSKTVSCDTLFGEK